MVCDKLPAFLQLPINFYCLRSSCQHWIRTVPRVEWQLVFPDKKLRSINSQRILEQNIWGKNGVSGNEHMCPMHDWKTTLKPPRDSSALWERRVHGPHHPYSVLHCPTSSGPCWVRLSLWALPHGDRLDKHSYSRQKVGCTTPNMFVLPNAYNWMTSEYGFFRMLLVLAPLQGAMLRSHEAKRCTWALAWLPCSGPAEKSLIPFIVTAPMTYSGSATS